ncbi:MAG: GNAT family N-acetyltransferase [Candidatus Methanomethylophilaceae archaeon]
MYWRDDYEKKVTNAKRAISKIKKGRSIFIGGGCGQPHTLVDELVKQSWALADNRIISPFTFSSSPFAAKKVADTNQMSAFSQALDMQGSLLTDKADYTPLHMSEIPRMMEAGRIPVDVALIQVSPPDLHGYCSLGVSVDMTKAAAKTAKLVIAEINRQMPRTLGDCFIHVSEIDHIIEVDYCVAHEPEFDDTCDEILDTIAASVATLVEDGATIQIGLGNVPNRVLRFLGDKKHLGVHTEMFSDGIIDLVEKGVITGKKKSIHPEKIITSFCIGSARLMEFVDNNPTIEFHSCGYTNNPLVIGRNRSMVAINTAPSVDLTGQVSADRSAIDFFSSPGGQEDFVRGASYAERGRSILAIPSVDASLQHSRIVSAFPRGAGVSSTREDMHYVVTEYGIAHMRGKTIAQRALELINIAHPDFRKQLLREAKELGYLPQDQSDTPYMGKPYPREYEHWEIFSGQRLFIRPIKPTDEEMIKEFFYSFSERTLQQRFMSPRPLMGREVRMSEVNIDYDTTMAFGVFKADAHSVYELVAISNYRKDVKTNTAEVSFMVKDDWQGKRLGTYLLNLMIRVGRQRGIKAFTAEVLATNVHMLNLFYKTGLDVKTKLEEDVYTVYFDLLKSN